jgi:hypothetical protein
VNCAGLVSGTGLRRSIPHIFGHSCVSRVPGEALIKVEGGNFDGDSGTDSAQSPSGPPRCQPCSSLALLALCSSPVLLLAAVRLDSGTDSAATNFKHACRVSPMKPASSASFNHAPLSSRAPGDAEARFCWTTRLQSIPYFVAGPR